MARRSLRHWQAFLACCCFSFLAGDLTGCSHPKTGYVSGHVTLGGKPVTEGSVLFEDAKAGISVQAALGKDGSYTVKTYDRDGLPPGTYKVAISPSTFGSGETPLAVNPATQAAAPASPVPQRYTRTATSGLSATVKLGDNPPFDFNLSP